MYKYFVHFTWVSNSENGDGCIEIQRNAPVTSHEDIVSMQNSILESIHVKDATVVITNFRRFEEPE